MGTFTAINGFVKNGKLDKDLSVFDGQEVLIISKADFSVIAGSDSARHREEVAEQALESVKKAPDKAQEILAQLGARK